MWWSRVEYYWLSIAIMTVISSFLWLKIRATMKHFQLRINFQQWAMGEGAPLLQKLFALQIYVLAPFSEELIFRMPLLILCTAISKDAWHSIYISSFLFAAIHWFRPAMTALDIMIAKQQGLSLPNDNKEAIKFLEQQYPMEVFQRKTANVILMFGLGMLLGWLTVSTQTIWWAVLVHAVWNFIMPFLLPLIVILISGIIRAILWMFAPGRFPS